MWFWIIAGTLLVLLLTAAWVWDRRHGHEDVDVDGRRPDSQPLGPAGLG